MAVATGAWASKVGRGAYTNKPGVVAFSFFFLLISSHY